MMMMMLQVRPVGPDEFNVESRIAFDESRCVFTQDVANSHPGLGFRVQGLGTRFRDWDFGTQIGNTVSC